MQQNFHLLVFVPIHQLDHQYQYHLHHFLHCCHLLNHLNLIIRNQDRLVLIDHLLMLLLLQHLLNHHQFRQYPITRNQDLLDLKRRPLALHRFPHPLLVCYLNRLNHQDHPNHQDHLNHQGHLIE